MLCLICIHSTLGPAVLGVLAYLHNRQSTRAYNYVITITCISLIAGGGALTDILLHARLPWGAQCPRASTNISGKAQVPAI